MVTQHGPDICHTSLVAYARSYSQVSISLLHSRCTWRALTLWHSYRYWRHSSEHSWKIPSLPEFPFKVADKWHTSKYQIIFTKSYAGDFGWTDRRHRWLFYMDWFEATSLRRHLSKYLNTTEKPACRDQRRRIPPRESSWSKGPEIWLDSERQVWQDSNWQRIE